MGIESLRVARRTLTDAVYEAVPRQGEGRTRVKNIRYDVLFARVGYVTNAQVRREVKNLVAAGRVIEERWGRGRCLYYRSDRA